MQDKLALVVIRVWVIGLEHACYLQQAALAPQLLRDGISSGSGTGLLPQYSVPADHPVPTQAVNAWLGACHSTCYSVKLQLQQLARHDMGGDTRRLALDSVPSPLQRHHRMYVRRRLLQHEPSTVCCSMHPSTVCWLLSVSETSSPSDAGPSSLCRQQQGVGWRTW